MSDLFKLNFKDLGKGLIVAALAAIITGLYQVLQTGALPDAAALKTIGTAALVGCVGYLVKNLFTGSNVVQTYSEFFKLNWMDVLKGFVTAVLTALVGGIYNALQTGTLPDMAAMKVILIASVTTGLAYLIKNVFTNSNGQLLSK